MESEHTTSSMSQDIGKFAENAGVTRLYMVINTALKLKMVEKQQGTGETEMLMGHKNES